MQKLKVPRYIQWLIITGFVFLLVMTILRFAFVVTYKHTFSINELLPSFYLGFRYDLRIVSIVTLLIFLLNLIKPFRVVHSKAGKKTALSIFLIFSFVFCLFYILDFAFYSYLSQRLTGSILNYAEDASISLAMVWQTYPVILLTLSLLAGVLLLMWFIKRSHRKISLLPDPSTKPARIGWGVVFFILLAIAIFGRVGQYPLRWSDAFALGNDYKSQVAFNPFQSFFSSLNYRHATYDREKVKHHYDFMVNYLGITNPNNENLNFERIIDTVQSALKKPNVVLVICESFSSFKSSMVNNPLNTTPFFNEMVSNGIYFDRCFSPTYGTAKGVWALITGIPDVQLNSTASRNPAAVDQHTIINDFKGYEKYYFLGGSTSWANIRGVLTNNISNLHLYEEGDYKAAKIDVWGISDKNLFLESNKILAKERKPFFAIIQTADNHRPYTIPEEDLNAFKKINLPLDTLAKYGFSSVEEYNAFRYTDFTFQEFIKAAKEESYFDNTIFVFIGDHGIYGGAGNMLPKTFSEMRLTAEHIPLLFYAPKILKPSRFSFASSQVDVLPTIAGLTKIKYRNTTLGRDLLQPGIENNDAAFIIDIDLKTMGVVSNNIFYNKSMVGRNEAFGSTINNDPVRITDSLKQRYKNMTDAFYETARYLLLNNKKKGG